MRDVNIGHLLSNENNKAKGESGRSLWRDVYLYRTCELDVRTRALGTMDDGMARAHLAHEIIDGNYGPRDIKRSIE